MVDTISTNNKGDSQIYKVCGSGKTGNLELDKARKQSKYNSMPNMVRAIVEGMNF